MNEDPLNLLLAWTEAEAMPEKREEDDVFVTDLPFEQGRIAAGEVEQDWTTGTDFEWSEDRAKAIDRALVRLGQAPAARICNLLRELLEHRTAPDFGQRLEAAERWLHEQLPSWQKPLQARPSEGDEEAEMVCSFNEALSSAAGGIGLALEVVEILRSGEPHQLPLAEALLRQVNDFFQNARSQLLAAEPPPEGG